MNSKVSSSESVSSHKVLNRIASVLTVMLIGGGVYAPAVAQDANEGATSAAPDGKLLNPAIQKGIGFVNLARIFRESDFIAMKREEINAEFEERERELEEKVTSLEQQRDQLGKDRLVSTTAQLQTQRDQINELEILIQRETRDLADDKRLRFDAAQRDLEKIVVGTIQEVSSERENFIVFDLSTILFAETSLEITDEVIERLDEKAAATAQ